MPSLSFYSTVLHALYGAGTSTWNAALRWDIGSVKHRRETAATAVRTVFNKASLKDIQSVMPASAAKKAYKDHIKSLKGNHQRNVEIVDLGDDTEAFWLGKSDKPDKLIIYLPGGGYVMPALPGHFSLVQSLVDDVQADIGVLFLNYDLVPEAAWPRQLNQATALLRYAVEELKISPEDIILQGDSAGGHLVLALLSHLSQAHPDVESLDLHNKKFQGALLLSPWSSFNTKYPSYKRNALHDSLSSISLTAWSNVFLNGKRPDPYTDPSTAKHGWWKNIPVDKIFIGAGENEVLQDPIQQLYETLENENKDVYFRSVEGETHVQPITDFALGLTPGTQYTYVKEWLSATITG